MTPAVLAIVWPLCALALVLGLLTGHQLVELRRRYRMHQREIRQVRRSLAAGARIRAAEGEMFGFDALLPPDHPTHHGSH